MDKVKKNKINILIVDDDEIYLKLIERQLRSTDSKIILERSPKQALKILSNEKIDLVISDFNMTEMDGFRLFTYIKAMLKNIPVIINSGMLDYEIKKEAIQSGVYAFYTKPANEMIINDIELIKNKIIFA